MIKFLTYLLAGLYCFVWLRIPDIGGVALPLQRLVAWAALFALLGHLALKGHPSVGPVAHSFLRVVFAFLGYVLLNLAQQLAYSSDFYLLYFAMDFVKYLAIFTVAYVVYYALTTRLVTEERVVGNLLLSATASTILVYGFLALYFMGFRTDNAVLAPTFGSALGVWPTTGVLPRLAGTAAEPQQLSVLLLTPLLLMLARDRIRRFWPMAGLVLFALLLSQSKFAVLSLLFVALYVYIVYERQRSAIAISMAFVAPIVGTVMLRLPTFAETLPQGTSAGAFVERFENVLLLLGIIQTHPWFGIGAGHFGVYRGLSLYSDPRYQPGYTPNMDFLKVFAETGVAGFVMLLVLLGALVLLFLRSYKWTPAAKRDSYLAFLLGALAILLNMAIGYELLHVFFWINIGVLMYFAEMSRRSNTRPGLSAGGPSELARE